MTSRATILSVRGCGWFPPLYRRSQFMTFLRRRWCLMVFTAKAIDGVRVYDRPDCRAANGLTPSIFISSHAGRTLRSTATLSRASDGVLPCPCRQKHPTLFLRSPVKPGFIPSGLVFFLLAGRNRQGRCRHGGERAPGQRDGDVGRLADRRARGSLCSCGEAPVPSEGDCPAVAPPNRRRRWVGL